MELFITGGAGFIGYSLAAYLSGQGHRVTILSRSLQRPAAVERTAQAGEPVFIQGDPTRPGDWQDAAARADVVVNLAGASIFRRWSAKVKNELLESRIQSTKRVVEAMNRAPGSGRLLLSASAVGFYGPHPDAERTETAPAGTDFLARLAVGWEAEARRAEAGGIRVVLMRFGVVLGRRGGALKQMLLPFRLGLGGRLGSGRQWFSWIHQADLEKAVSFLIERADQSGPFNFTAPHPVTNLELTRSLARALRRPAIFPVPSSVLRLAAGEFAAVLLEGQKVLPARLLEAGFRFQHPGLETALADLLHEKPAAS